MNDDMLHPATSSVPASRLTCAQCERMIQDALDGTLLPEDRRQFDLHVAGCPDCSRAMAEAQQGFAWLEMLKGAPPAPPSALLERILAQTSGDPAVAIPVQAAQTLLGGPQRAFPAGHMAAVLPFQLPVRRNLLARATYAAMQPRFALTAAMAFFSVALTMNLTGVQLRDIRLSSLKPANLRHSFWSANARVVRYYDSLRVVYELESRVRELQKDPDENRSAQPAAPPAQNDQDKKAAPAGNGTHSSLPTRNSPATPTRSGLRRHTALLASTFALPRGSNAASAAGNRGEGAQG